MSLPRTMLIDEGRLDGTTLVATLEEAFSLGIRWVVLARRRLGEGGDLLDAYRSLIREWGGRLLLEQEYPRVIERDLDGVLLTDPDPPILRARQELGPERVLALVQTRAAPPDPDIRPAIDVLVSTLPRATGPSSGLPRFLDVRGAQESQRALPDVRGAVIRVPGRPATDVREATRSIISVWGSL